MALTNQYFTILLEIDGVNMASWTLQWLVLKTVQALHKKSVLTWKSYSYRPFHGQWILMKFDYHALCKIARKFIDSRDMVKRILKDLCQSHGMGHGQHLNLKMVMMICSKMFLFGCICCYSPWVQWDAVVIRTILFKILGWETPKLTCEHKIYGVCFNSWSIF